MCLLCLVSLINDMRVLYLCATVEPGIIPKIRSKALNYQRPYKVTYREPGDEDPRASSLHATMTPVEKYFSLNNFKLADNQNLDPPLTESLSYCNTCQIVRPPRSFHCRDCGVCIEVHDHHCPWMGTCIGLRNIRYFVCFLAYTALHAFLVCLYSVSFFATKTKGKIDIFGSSSSSDEEEEDEEDMSQFQKIAHIWNLVAMIYSFAFFMMLACFACSMHVQVMDNVTTNESIRKKWNAKNREARNNREERVSACDKFKFMYFGRLPVSRVERYHSLRQ